MLNNVAWLYSLQQLEHSLLPSHFLSIEKEYQVFQNPRGYSHDHSIIFLLVSRDLYLAAHTICAWLHKWLNPYIWYLGKLLKPYAWRLDQILDIKEMFYTDWLHLWNVITILKVMLYIFAELSRIKKLQILLQVNKENHLLTWYTFRRKCQRNLLNFIANDIYVFHWCHLFEQVL